MTDRRRPAEAREVVVKTGGQEKPKSIVLHIHLDGSDEEPAEPAPKPRLTGPLYDWRNHYHPLIAKQMERFKGAPHKKRSWTRRAIRTIATLAWSYAMWRAFLSI